MKKMILPFVAVMLIATASNAQTTPKQGSNKTVAVAKPKTTTKTTSTVKETVSAPKPTTTTAKPVAIHKKHHHKIKKAAKK